MKKIFLSLILFIASVSAYGAPDGYKSFVCTGNFKEFYNGALHLQNPKSIDMDLSLKEKTILLNEPPGCQSNSDYCAKFNFPLEKDIKSLFGFNTHQSGEFSYQTSFDLNAKTRVLNLGLIETYSNPRKDNKDPLVWWITHTFQSTLNCEAKKP